MAEARPVEFTEDGVPSDGIEETISELVDLYGGEIKCIVFGMMISTICCYKGITAKGGAEGVARAVHQSVVASFVSIQIFEYLYTPTVLALFHTNNVLR